MHPGDFVVVFVLERAGVGDAQHAVSSGDVDLQAGLVRLRTFELRGEQAVLERTDDHHFVGTGGGYLFSGLDDGGGRELW